MEAEIEALCGMAPNWSLAGDKQLLDVLQNLHQRIVTRCEETSKRLEDMVSSLDDASVHLENVNNRFMALSNTQFVERRVYDDDEDIAVKTVEKEPVKLTDSESELSSLALSVRVLEEMHESVVIIPDSDTDSDSGDEDKHSVVLKLKDPYSHRPLPYIIGSYQWNSKWHAGLVVEDSDSDSSGYRRRDKEQYSDSEPDSYTDRRVSSASSEHLPVPVPAVVPAALSPSIPVMSPSEVAAELARKLASQAPIKQTESDPVTTVQQPVIRKTYRPEQPTTGTIFPDEPPPFEPEQSYESERDSYTEEEDDDIFAQLRTEAKQSVNKQTSRHVDVAKNENKIQPTNVVKQEPPLFEDESDTELFVDKQKTNTIQQEPTIANKDNVKKPIGGISLFGSNQGAETIGAAILKRNQRKSSSDDDEEDDRIQQTQNTTNSEIVEPKLSKPSDIFDDLFAQSSQANKTTNKNKIETKKVTKPKVLSKEVEKPKVDLFSDNLFDDIDDIFTSNVTKSAVKSDSKPVFDEEELFADIAVANNENSAPKKAQVSKETKSIFDSDDDLFNDELVSTKIINNGSNEKTKASSESNKQSLFDDESEDELFTDNENKISQNQETNKTPQNISSKDIKSIFDDSDDDIFSDVKTNILKDNSKETIRDVKNKDTEIESDRKSETAVTEKATDKEIKAPIIINETPERKQETIFENESKETKVEPTKEKTTDIKKSDTQKDELFIKSTKPKESPSIFDDENDVDDLFITQTKENKNLSKDSEFNRENDFTYIEKVNSVNNLTSSSDSGTRTETTTPSNNIFTFKAPSFDDDDLFTDNEIIQIKEDEKTFETSVKQHVEETKTLEITSIKESQTDNTKKSDPNKNVIEDNDLFSTIQSTLSKTDDFTDIFAAQPPDFEKPKEPKKSKNVNALFDDDSDDEALFFKKDDPVVDEKPDSFDQNNPDRLFGLFHDEPPDVDVDFIHKTQENKQERSREKDYLVNTEIAAKSIDKNILETSDEQTKYSNIKPVVNIVDKETKTKQIIKEVKESKSISTLIENAENFEKDAKTIETEPRKAVGKLKAMNLNINVNALVPGASPKKVQKPVETGDKIDGNAFSTKSNEELNITDDKDKNIESKLVKSVSFDGDPDSGVLDNTFSKERAKIQVKRRPSTRRARKEAVRKSAIETDSTDNSSSIDDVKLKDDKTESNESLENSNIKESPDTESLSQSIKISPEHKAKADNGTSVEDIETNTQQVKSKTVYILNDEDLFPSPKKEVNVFETKKEIEQVNKPDTFPLLDDEDEIFKTSDVKIDKEPKGVTTLGQVYSEPKKTVTTTEKASVVEQKPEKSDKVVDKKETIDKGQQKTSLFGDSSDEELFGAKKKVAIVKSQKLFDSDTDEDLFSNKKDKVVEIKKDVKEALVKGSLFGDDDEDDDLFGPKTSKVSEPKQAVTKPSNRESTPKEAEPVFEDPLSLLGDNED